MLKWLSISATVIVLDLLTKYWIQQSFSYGEHLTVTSFFELVRYHNTGAAFSFLANAGGWQKWFFSAISVCVSAYLFYLLTQAQHNKLFSIGVALVLGGAIGNLYDRMTLGYVVDFLLFHYQGLAWPAFNIADSAICVGVGLLIWDSFQSSTQIAES